MKNIILFDSKGDNIQISNSSEEIETLLTNAPLVNKEDKLIGVILNAEHKIGTTLYKGTVYITDDKYKKFKILSHRISYREPPIKNIYDAINIVTIIEAVTD